MVSDLANGEGVKRSLSACLGRLEKDRAFEIRRQHDRGMVGERRARLVLVMAVDMVFSMKRGGGCLWLPMGAF